MDDNFDRYTSNLDLPMIRDILSGRCSKLTEELWSDFRSPPTHAWPTNVNFEASRAWTGTITMPHLIVLKTPYAVA